MNYFTIGYKLKERGENFSKGITNYTAHVLASTEEGAIQKLKSDFHMLDVEIDSVSEMKSIADEEYDNDN